MGTRDVERAGIDMATGFGNRAALKLAAAPAIAVASRNGYSLAVAVIGLAEAEDAWDRDQSISLAMRASLRASDQVFRLDADTLVALLPMAAGRAVGAVMERAARLADRPFLWGAAFAGLDGWELGQLVARAAARLHAVS
jgi:GGDEF domain-containing protein